MTVAFREGFHGGIRPVSERAGLGRSYLVFDGADRARLEELGDVRTPSLADIFVARMSERQERAA